MEQVKFLFDPRSPWCYQASRWARRLEELGEIELDWGVFSLEVVNYKQGDPRDLVAEYGPALRSAMVIRDRFGSKEIGRFYAALGKIMWEAEEPPPPAIDDASRDALREAGFDPGIVDEALDDPKTWDAVLEEHAGYVENLHVFGVPTIVYNVGAGPMAFGPVIKALPDDLGAVELWRHVSWLVHHGSFFEVKRRAPSSAEVQLPAAFWRKQIWLDARAAAGIN